MRVTWPIVVRICVFVGNGGNGLAACWGGLEISCWAGVSGVGVIVDEAVVGSIDSGRGVGDDSDGRTSFCG